MKLNEGIEWAVHCVSVLSGMPTGATLPTKVLAEYHGLSETYLAKHLQALANAGIVESVPGPKGGYRLLRAAENITLLDIVEAIDGKEPTFRCTEIRQRGPLASCNPDGYRLPCGIHVAMMKADKAWRDALRAQTIAGLAGNYVKTVNPEHLQRVIGWFGERLRQPGKPS
ncbi:MAG TPA: Rrf2 family transcriptional regulator [Rickettsiales bacterium]|nr:Rrf2 family transcriptional regulator [Rickettsiales bacterium]